MILIVIHNAMLIPTEEQGRLSASPSRMRSIGGVHGRAASVEQQKSMDDTATALAFFSDDAPATPSRGRRQRRSVEEARTRWVPDESSTTCLLCNSRFGLLLRRHHCRKCGALVCHGCSSHMAALQGFAALVRVCDECYSLEKLRANMAQNIDDARRLTALLPHGEGAEFRKQMVDALDEGARIAAERTVRNEQRSESVRRNRMRRSFGAGSPRSEGWAPAVTAASYTPIRSQLTPTAAGMASSGSRTPPRTPTSGDRGEDWLPATSFSALRGNARGGTSFDRASFSSVSSADVKPTLMLDVSTADDAWRDNNYKLK